MSLAIADINEKFEANEIHFTFKFIWLFVCFIKSQVKWSANEDEPPFPHAYTVSLFLKHFFSNLIILSNSLKSIFWAIYSK